MKVFSFHPASPYEIVGIVAGISFIILLYALFFKRKVLKKRVLPEKPTDNSMKIAGNLKDTNLMETIQFLEMGNKEGILHVYCGRRKGYLTFAKGKLIDAFYRNQTGKEAIMNMFAIDEGDFYFEPKKIEQLEIVKDSVIDLAIEWDERRGEEH